MDSRDYLKENDVFFMQIYLKIIELDGFSSHEK